MSNTGRSATSVSVTDLPTGHFHQRPHAIATAARLNPGLARFQKRRASDVEMDPGFAADKLFEELGRGDRAAPAAVADVLDVGDFAADLLAVFGEHGKLPERLATGVGRGFDGIGPLLIVRHQTRDVIA